ncbi:MAG: colanic acid/amylovoran biosynthesis glycosyltransferase [Sphingomonadales bacterium]|jgi:glycosyltransferase involved in cell wall biosynthesis|nr:colanic acid/amylovoran biosynthesis glycosyltransferase [Sphingomonadales bacterium]
MVSTDERPVAAIFRAPLFNGSETFVQAHAAGLRRYRAVVAGVEDKGNARAELRPSLIVEPEGARLKLFGSAPRLLARLREVRPALVHAHFATDGLLALPLAEALGVPLVTTLHGFDVTRSRAALLRSGRPGWMRYAWLGRRLRARGALFVGVSDAIRRRALAQGFPAERTVTLLNGVDLARFEAGTPEPGLVLHVGRLVEKKGTALLLRAFAEVARRRPEARLVIVGDGPLRARLERQAGERVTFAGALPPEEVARWMGRAWLLAAPSVTAADGDSEGLPTVVCEAAAASLPVVASDHSGLPEAVVDGETGFIVPEGDAVALAERLETLLESPDLRARMAGTARRMAEERFDSVLQIAALEALYDRVTGRCG